LVSDKWWYDTGARMSEMTRDDTGLNAKSFDGANRLTGEVKNGNGALLIPLETGVSFATFNRQHYKDGKAVTDEKIHIWPKLTVATVDTPQAQNTATFRLEVLSSVAMKSIRLDLRLPTGSATNQSISFAATNAQIHQFPAFTLKFPTPYQVWTGDVTADVTVQFDDCATRFPVVVLHRE
jgi:hypothetical protein